MRRSSVAAFDAFAAIALGIHEGRAELTEVLDLIAQSAATLLQTDIAWLVLADPARVTLRPVVLVGFRSPDFLKVSLPMNYGVVGQALATRRTVAVEDYHTYQHPTSAAVRGVIEGEGIRSLICCPLFRVEESIGALYVGRRRPSTFSHDDIRLLEALAGQASVAIENQRLYTRLREQNDMLERSLAIHQQFTQASLRGVGLPGIAEILFNLLGYPVRITPSAPELAPVTHPADVEDINAQRPRTNEAIEANGRSLGTLQVFHQDPLSSLDVTAVEHARTVCGLELVKVGFAGEVERRYRSSLLDDLLEASPDDYPAMESRARRFQLDLSGTFRLVVMQASAGLARETVDDVVRRALHDELGARRTRILLTTRKGRVVAAAPADLDDHIAPLVGRIRARLAELGLRGAIGVGPLSRNIRQAYAAADACASLGDRSGSAEGVGVVTYDDLGLMNFLLDAPSIDFTRIAVARRLEPLTQHDRTSRMQLLPTLREYLAADGHHGRACERLFIGATTLKYRLGKAADLLGADLRDPRTRFELQLALHMQGFLSEHERRADGAGTSGAAQ